MPQVTAPDGTTKYVPGVYFDTKVRTSLPGPLPDFQIPVILASAWQGNPYNVDTLVQTNETKPGAAKYLRTASAAGEFFGYGSDMHVAFENAVRHGLTGAYCVSLSAMTRASVIADASGTNQATVYSVSFGAPGGWTRIKFSGGIVTVTKLKNYAFLSANFTSGATRVNLKGNVAWIQEGKTYSIGSNTIAIASVTVTRKGVEIDANGQEQWFVELSAAFGSNLTTAGYAMLGEYDTVNTFTTKTTITTSQEFIDIINRDLRPLGLIGAIKHAAFTGTIPDTVAAATPIKELTTWATNTAGTSPAAVAADVTAFVAAMNAGGWDDFLLRNSVIPQAYLLVMSDSTSQGIMRDYAAAERRRGFGISVVTGPRWGDTVLSAGDDTDPLKRCLDLNSQDVQLCGPGAERLAPHLTMAAAVFGRRCSGGIGHNLTNDELVFKSYEKAWDEINSGQLSALCRAGFTTIKLSTGRKPRYRVSQGLSTLQANGGLIWNVSTKDTWSVMQRDLADFVDRVQLVDLEEDIVGADGVSPSVIAQALRTRADKSLIGRGILLEYTVTLIALNDGANGYNVQQSYRLPTTNDFVGLESTILIG